MRLADYLLAGSPSSVIILGVASAEIQWSAMAVDGVPKVLKFDTLAECSTYLGQEGNDIPPGPQVALLPLTRVGQALETELGQAVRLFPEKLLVSIDSAEPEDAALFAFGFRRLALEEQGSTRWFEYSLRHYKQPPEWLNARFWANPERFGQDEDTDIDADDYGDEEE
jgi:hypothetical protein